MEEESEANAEEEGDSMKNGREWNKERIQKSRQSERDEDKVYG